jgi:predicted outer membrane protein
MYKASSIAGAFALTLVGAIVASCSDDDKLVAGAEDTGVGDAATPPGGDAAPSDAGNDVIVEMVQDPQIAQVLLTVNRRELDESRIAKDFALTTRTHDFAELMVNEYTAINERQVALFSVLGLVPVDSETNRQLQSESDAVLAKLEALPVDLDRVYMDAQVAGHTEVLALINRQLLPAASSAELKSELRTLQDAVQGHLDAARAAQTPSAISPQ